VFHRRQAVLVVDLELGRDEREDQRAVPPN
jgi:hypothetical protein